MMRAKRNLTRMLVAGLTLGLVLSATAWAQRGQPATVTVPSYIKKAMADPARAKDQTADQRRRPGPILTLSGIKPGDTVIELVPGGGYWTRMFSQIVGPEGHVYAILPSGPGKEKPHHISDAMQAIADNPHYANVRLLQQPASQLSAPNKADLVFTAENIHDYNNKGMGNINPKALAGEVLKVLKPGGIFLVNDHVAPKGSGLTDTSTLHRIDPATVKKQITAAGFTFEGSSNALHNPKDTHKLKVFDKKIRGHTDQFVYKFRKPMR